MSFLTALGARERRAAVTISWPHGGPADRVSAPDPQHHAGLGISSDARVQTDRGLVRAADLVPGDMLSDGRGGRARLAAAIRIDSDLGSERVMIGAGSLGEGVPLNDLVVGRKTRLCLRSDLARRLVGRSEVAVAAETLLDLDGVSLVSLLKEIVTHLVFEEHATVTVEGAVVEALIPSEAFLESLPHKPLQAIYAALPKLRYRAAHAAYLADLPELDRREAVQILAAPTSFREVQDGSPRGASPAGDIALIAASCHRCGGCDASERCRSA